MVRTRRAVFAAGALTVLLLSTTGAAAQDTVRLYTRMTGAAERPTPNDSPGTGDATVFVNPDDTVCVVLRVAALTTPVVGAHIHIGPSTEAGGIVVHLTPPTSGFSYTCTAVAPALAEQLRTNPSAYYVNVHTTRFPGGEIRGQLAAV
jgi:hypothetical protein